MARGGCSTNRTMGPAHGTFFGERARKEEKRATRLAKRRLNPAILVMLSEWGDVGEKRSESKDEEGSRGK